MTSCRHGYRPGRDDDLCALAQKAGNCHEKTTCGSKVKAARGEPTYKRRGPKKIVLKIRCIHGHPLDGIRRRKNGKTSRYCLVCNARRNRLYRRNSKLPASA